MLNEIKHLIMDMDGVLWLGETPIPGLAAFFETLQREGIDFMLATNNATKTAELYTQKLARFGIDVAPESILTSAETTAQYLSEQYERGTAVYIVGARGLHDAFRAHGFTIITPAEVEQGVTAALVVAGFTPEVTYHDMAMATLLINKGATFYGTNADPTFPSELGHMPGAGALLAFIATAAGVTPKTFGKPEPIMYEQALQRLGGTKENTAMVGDRLSTDIAGANAAGMRSILVLTGVSSQADITDSSAKPDFVFEDIGELADALSKVREAR
jgi:4-nitrophenyl phosphatase